MVVGNDVVAIGQLHLFGDDHQGAAVVALGKAPGIVPVHVEANGAVVDDISVGTADTAVIVNGIKLIVVDVVAEITQNTLEKGLGVNPQEKVGIDILLLGSGDDAPNHFLGEVGMHAANHHADGLPLSAVHGITSRRLLEVLTGPPVRGLQSECSRCHFRYTCTLFYYSIFLHKKPERKLPFL